MADQSPRVLFLTTPEQDYLQDCMFYGLRQVLGDQCIDLPRKDVLYSNCRIPSDQLYGRGFTIWKLLDETSPNRQSVIERIVSAEFDLVIFGSVNRQRDAISQFLWPCLRSRTKVVFLDGEDSSDWRKKQMLGLLGSFYKREQTGFGRLFVKCCGFSIPSVKITNLDTPKQFMFAKHVQCVEAYRVPWISENCQARYPFEDELGYRRNLEQSRYGVTMKKGGWDCMRHYEIAAAGAVNAFYRLSAKPKSCAPHGLIDMVNAIGFDSAEELEHKVEVIHKARTYDQMRSSSLLWVREHACESVAYKLLATELGWQPNSSGH